MPTVTLFEEPAAFDLDAYLARIGYRGPVAPTVDVLHGIHAAHAAAIPFENLDILLGRAIRVDAEAIVEKLVHGRRGGYCFEQNLLLGAALESAGFSVALRLGRVNAGERLRPRTHLVLEVPVAGELWHADCGFGATGLLNPMRKSPGVESPQFRESFRMDFADGVWSVQAERDGAWTTLYSFSDEPQHWIDVHAASFYVSNHPDSIFRKVLTVQRVGVDGKRSLRNETLVLTDPDGTVTEARVGDDTRLDVLAERFGLRFPAGTPLRVPPT